MKQRLRLLLEEFLLDKETLVDNQCMDKKSLVDRVHNLLNKLREYIQLNRDTKIEAMFLQLTDTEKVTLFDDNLSRPMADNEASQPQSTLTLCPEFLPSLPPFPDLGLGPGVHTDVVTAEIHEVNKAPENVTSTGEGREMITMPASSSNTPISLSQNLPYIGNNQVSEGTATL